MNTFFERTVMTVVLTTAVTAGYLAIERAPQASVPPTTAAAVAAGQASAHARADGSEQDTGADLQRMATGAGGNLVIPPRRPEFKRQPKDSVTALHDWFAELNYDLDHIQDGNAHVPPAFLASLPPDLGNVPETAMRKRLFFQAVLPLILRANQEILTDRKRLWQLHADQRLGRRIAPADRLWLTAMAERYKVPADNLALLIRRIDVIPPSMALAQAAEESGWGTSRFARQGNAIFGQWTTADGPGLVPRDRDGDKDHKVRAFNKLIDSVRAYMLNLNTHRAYRELRRARAALRRSGEPLNGHTLARFLHRYSERGDDYVGAIRAMIEANGLDRLDDARLLKVQRPEA
ncbi:glucosaminidase domain-containing protein [Thalassospiraceae bacterium LMO-SO8]|nr:glucosaminidase domain-containing protein [Alphaproteobacteria bacterium LMO-S08]WND77505.1 glucosaminidase domain-containing protein [Thalassospiraceae bacterium LMO-SO8]